MYKNKKIFILGMARSGYECAKLLSNYNNSILINDGSADQNLLHVEELEKLGVSVILGNHPDDIFDENFDYLVKNPGIKDNHKYIVKAKQLNIPVVNEIEVAYHFLPKNVKIIGITGTNGKTTTTTLTYEIINKQYKNSHLIGNMGFPLSSFIDKIKENDILVMEISAQQLLNFNKFKTNISVITNLSEAHTDHFGTYENYVGMKKRIFNNLTKNDLSITNLNDNLCVEQIKDTISKKEYFSIDKKTDIYLDNDEIIYKNEKIINIKDIRLVGNHNYENIMCAICICKELNIKNEYIIEVLNNFVGVEHRLEFVSCINDRNFYNDSKATNNISTIIALKAFKTPTILIMGGLDRGQSFDELLPHTKNVKFIVCYGETKNKIDEFCKTNSIKVYVVNNLEEATKLAYNMSEKNDTILLSPACASWDQYKKFEDRGLDFKNVINNLEGNDK